MGYGYIDTGLKRKLDSCKPILFKLFPNSEIEILLRELDNKYHSEYILSIHDQKKNRLGYLEVSLAWRRVPNLVSILLHEDFCYSILFAGKAFVRETGEYTRRKNWEEIENILKEIWDILAEKYPE